MMLNKIIKIIFISLILNTSLINLSISEIVKEIKINGNNRISKETILMFSQVDIDQDLDNQDLNILLKNLYETNYFENVSVKLSNNLLEIQVIENPIIQDINYEGIKSNRIKNLIVGQSKLKSRSSYNELILRKDIENIKSSLKDLGYYFPEIETYIEDLKENKINLTYNISLGEKAKIKTISFIGDKKFKDKKLKSIIVSEENRFWKFVTSKKFVNENLISLDKRLLKNFYLNKGFYNVKIDSSFAKLINKNEFELIYNIQANEKFYFNDLNLKLPNDFETENFSDLKIFLSDLKGEPYSINTVRDILKKIDIVTLSEEFQSISAKVEENISEQKINLDFIVEETKATFVERINIYGNNVTRESVIRNQFEIDEGDPFNEILSNKSINNLKSLNYFKKVSSEITEGSTKDLKIINVTVEEKPTGEISAGAGVGTSGGSISFGIKENNYMGKGISLATNVSLTDESLKGLFSVTNPNFNNSDKLVYFSVEAIEIDRLVSYGYQTNKTGVTLGTNFEYLNNFKIGLGNSNFYEKIDTDSTASARQKTQEGNYWDSFLNLNFDYDTRNQKFQTTDGFRSRYFVDLPLISETATLSNTYLYKHFTELYENNVSSLSFYLSSAISLKDEDIKLSERIILPSSRLRGFERGKVGPKDGDDFIGGNYAATVNFSSTIPQILSNSENIDFLFFVDVGNVWGVDYFDGEDEGSKIRSSTGFGIDWLTPVGPLNFTLATAITKADTDKTESFRFNLGTSF